MVSFIDKLQSRSLLFLLLQVLSDFLPLDFLPHFIRNAFTQNINCRHEFLLFNIFTALTASESLSCNVFVGNILTTPHAAVSVSKELKFYLTDSYSF